MNIRYISILILLFSVCSAYADKKMTIRNSDTGESFEVTVPDGLKIYEYNSNWLDSVPYLLERARYGEPWAYEALGDCYRYGKGGVEKSMFKTFFYYEFAGIDVEQQATESIKENPTDQFGNTCRLIEILENGDMAGAISFIDTLSNYHHSDAAVIKDLVCETDTIARKSATAIAFLEKADKEAMLSRKGAEILFRHYQSEIEAGRKAFDAENMERLAVLAKLPDYDTYIFTDK